MLLPVEDTKKSRRHLENISTPTGRLRTNECCRLIDESSFLIEDHVQLNEDQIDLMDFGVIFSFVVW